MKVAQIVFDELDTDEVVIIDKADILNYKLKDLHRFKNDNCDGIYYYIEVEVTLKNNIKILCYLTDNLNEELYLTVYPDNIINDLEIYFFNIFILSKNIDKNEYLKLKLKYKSVRKHDV